ncbi:MAG: MotA/TolQ/ExbB proton channel family protein [Candidatus Omnitrophica bacterium]|nr:MotA/TolQ/ExbB proton channel family protein [Candidatus Omnitrophota bacterium]
MFEVIQKGGPLMIPILGCSVLAMAFVIERLVHLYRAQIDTQAFLTQIKRVLAKGGGREAVELCNRTPGPVSHILRAGILDREKGKAQIRESIEDAALFEVPRLERNLNLLATIAHISPLLGLLGTVTGMIRAFQVLQEKAGGLAPINPADLAGGIWEALITTAAGLLVAIPTYVAYNYLVSRVNGFVLDMERSATQLVQILTEERVTHEV